MNVVLAVHRDAARRSGQGEMAARYDALVRLALPVADGVRPDLDAVAEQWLDWLKPMWFDKLRHRGKRRRPLLLRDLTKDLMKQEIDLDRLESKFQRVPVVDQLDERIAASIVGVDQRSIS